MQQALVSLSRLFILAGISFSLLFIWYTNNSHLKQDINELTSLRYTPIDDTNTIIPDETPVAPEPSQAKHLTRNMPSRNAPNIWSTISGEFRLDHNAQSPRVQAEIRRLLADQKSLYRILNSAEPYIYYIHEQVRARHLPAELALIPAIESQFNPNDYSKKGATGLWQLMPATARVLGVKIRPGYDGRRNLVASTKAALTYFKDLGVNFNGDWYLALAAYNCGQVKVASAMRYGKTRDFWKLRLPLETQHYVPKLLAVAEIIKNPKKYKIKLPSTMNKPYFVELKTKKPINLKQAAKLSGAEENRLRALNPDYNHIVIANKGAYSLLVPANHFSSIKNQLAKGVIVA